MADRYSPIAVFDSGLGGISVLRELIKVMPHENYIYFGDSENAPYGVKSLEQVRSLTIGHASELFNEGAKGLVVACNTATSAAVRILREMYPQVPIVGIEPAVKPAALSGGHPEVLVMATPMTVREEKFRILMERYIDYADIIPLPCPGLMEFIERGDLEGDDLRVYLEDLLCDYKDGKVDAVVLGCTHYPFARHLIQEIVGSSVMIYDGGEGTARQMRRQLDAAGLLNPGDAAGRIEFRNSDDSPGKIELCHRLFEM
ncbi:MAG: glutamate racemase [Clostridiales bacterium]|nr:glutamate racemase [Clostridiales bacterium]